MAKKYLDKYGLEYYHDLIRAGLSEYIEGTQTSATSAWTGVSTTPDLFKGKLVVYHLPYASAPSTLNLKFPSGNTSGAKRIKGSTESFPAGTKLAMIYTGTEWQVITAESEAKGGYLEVARFDVAGTYTWTADFTGKIGVLVIGGGGGGAAATNVPTSEKNVTAYGGNSGYRNTGVVNVTAGTQYPIVVGTGGAALTLTRNETFLSGNSGEYSVFGTAYDFTKRVYGGGGGASGWSTEATKSEIGAIYSPYYGMYSMGAGFGNYAKTGDCPWTAINPFTGEEILGGGGAAGVRYENGQSIASGSLPSLNNFTGKGGGNGVTTGGTGADATENGCGGGGAAAATASESAPLVSGKGGDGLVVIYRYFE